MVTGVSGDASGGLSGGGSKDEAARVRGAVLAGHRGDEARARAALRDADPGVRAAALSALARMGAVRPRDVDGCLADPDPSVRRRACEVAAAGATPTVDVGGLLDDPDPTVVEAA